MSKPWDDLPPKGPFLRPKDAALHLGISKATLYREIDRGNLFKPFKIGMVSSGFPVTWLDAYATAQVRP